MTSNIYRIFATFFPPRYVPFAVCQFPQKLMFSAVGSADALSSPCGRICPGGGVMNRTASVGAFVLADPLFINQIAFPPIAAACSSTPGYPGWPARGKTTSSSSCRSPTRICGS